ncbi:helix-turn-helix transcriptional regulator [Kluyvera ascorbata]|uniref:helix-turn-helix transcriptional regulator n=1 Tax=Kluyvera ascorbata TaxID=51288 RepID=UPI00289AE87D|nr:LuxR C-terminal-related transcriptional regulator [Kluyvera ascorbata]MEB6388635.1 LuxR C-terminal-related transcriptional regulator [Kluyvera ascorbata]HDG1677844.1 helix-turn-helix transcriptional regulator [Kluyvera ascorbata]HED3067523.1 helix-turn-helix transcriptional regulator [Kluyvera ascorbata]
MSSILILSDDFIFSEAIALLLTEVNSDVTALINTRRGADIHHVTYRANVNHALAVNECTSIIVDIHEDISTPTISILNRIKREYPLIRVMVFVNTLVDYQSPFTRVLMDLSDILVNRYESIPGLKRNLVQLELLAQRHSTIMFNRFSRSRRLKLNCSDSMFSRLSKRELEVINHLAQGKSPAEIADELYISTKTVYTHRQRIYAKLGVKNIIELHKIMRITSIL